MPNNQTTAWSKLRWNLYAPVYDFLFRYLQVKRHKAFAGMKFKPRAKILIVGCGTGLDLNHLPKDVEVTALDASSEMLSRFEKRASRLNIRALAYLQDAETPYLTGQAFDYVFLHYILAVCPNPQIVLQNAMTKLNEDGMLSIMDKFAPDGVPIGNLRKALNPISKALATSITLRFADLELIDNFVLFIDTPIAWKGNIRHILLKKIA